MYLPTCQPSLKEIFNLTCLRKNKEVLYLYGIYWAKFNNNELLLKNLYVYIVYAIVSVFSAFCSNIPFLHVKTSSPLI